MSADPIAMSGDQFRLLNRRSAPLLWGVYFSLGLSVLIGVAADIVFKLDPNGLVNNLTWLGIASVGSISVSLLTFQILGSRIVACGAFFVALLMLGARVPMIAGAIFNS